MRSARRDREELRGWGSSHHMNGGDVDRGAGGFARVLGGPGREKEQAREEEGRCEFASRAGRGESEFHLLVLDFWIPHHTRSLSFSVKTNQFESQQRKPSQEGKQLRSGLNS